MVYSTVCVHPSFSIHSAVGWPAVCHLSCAVTGTRVCASGSTRACLSRKRRDGTAGWQGLVLFPPLCPEQGPPALSSASVPACWEFGEQQPWAGRPRPVPGHFPGLICQQDQQASGCLLTRSRESVTLTLRLLHSLGPGRLCSQAAGPQGDDNNSSY